MNIVCYGTVGDKDRTTANDSDTPESLEIEEETTEK